ncbi:MAG: hypothetical protein PVJ69_04550 [Desulfobacteraceae bacterium]
MIQASQEAEARDVAAIQLDGKFIDYPVVERARRTLGLAKMIKT